jgi:lactate permease
MVLAATGFTQHLNPLNSILGSTLVALLPLALLLVLLAVMRVTAWLAVIIGAVVTIIMAITIWDSPVGPTFQAWGIGAATGIWSIDWIVFWGGGDLQRPGGDGCLRSLPAVAGHPGHR